METTLAEVLRKATHFVRAIEIYAESTDGPKKAKVRSTRTGDEGIEGQGSKS